MARYTSVLGIVTEKGEIYPIWDPRISYAKSYHSKITQQIFMQIGDDEDNVYALQSIGYDVMTGKLLDHVVLDYYTSTKFIEGQSVLVAYQPKCFQKITIDKVEYRKFDPIFETGKHFKEWFPSLTLEDDIVYLVKNWTPCFVVCKDGVERVYHEWELYHLKE